MRGANTAFQDAQSLGWHLAYTVKGLAGPRLMANYSAERVGAAREIIHEAGKSTRFMTPPTRGFRLLRDAVLSLSLSQDFVRPLYHWRTSRPHEYTHSALNSPGDDDALFHAGPAHGVPPRNVRQGPNDYPPDHLGGGFDLLYFTTGTQVPPALMDAVQTWRARGVALRVTAIGAAAPVQGGDQTLSDQHVCARWLALGATRLHAGLQQTLSSR